MLFDYEREHRDSWLCRFAGLTVMHKFQISGGKVMYRNRHLNREAEHFIEAVGQEPGIMLWNDPCGTLLGRAFSLFKQAGQPTPESPCMHAFLAFCLHPSLPVYTQVSIHNHSSQSRH